MGSILFGLCVILIWVGVIWTAIIAFKSNDLIWGILSLICYPIVAIIYAAMNMNKAQKPLIIMVVGVVLGVLSGFWGFSTTGVPGP